MDLFDRSGNYQGTIGPPAAPEGLGVVLFAGAALAGIWFGVSWAWGIISLPPDFRNGPYENVLFYNLKAAVIWFYHFAFYWPVEFGKMGFSWISEGATRYPNLNSVIAWLFVAAYAIGIFWLVSRLSDFRFEFGTIEVSYLTAVLLTPVLLLLTVLIVGVVTILGFSGVTWLFAKA